MKGWLLSWTGEGLSCRSRAGFGAPRLQLIDNAPALIAVRKLRPPEKSTGTSPIELELPTKFGAKG